MEKFYLTTPIYYINGNPSVGHAYTTIAADVLARYYRLRGKNVFLLTGIDENSQKNVEAAEKAGRGSDVQGYLDEMAIVWQKTFQAMDISYTRFIRTTEQDHHRAVEKFWHLVKEKGDIYLGDYEGLYCKGCEAFVNESDLVDGKCPFHLKEPEHIVEKNYFFRLTAYRESLLAHIEKHPDFVGPQTRRNEIVSYIKNFMTDVSISRSTMKWGIPVPGDDSQRIYVWFDALINYLSGVGFGTNDQTFEKYWPADLHLMAKDIIKFHCALWPAMLMSAGLPLPKQVFAHGFFTVDGQKMSKSLGNVLDPVEIGNTYGHDVLRFFLLREIVFGEDGDFSLARLEERYEKELANELGNLVSRVLAMTEKYQDGFVPEKQGIPFMDKNLWSRYEQSIEALHLHETIAVIWENIRQANQYVEERNVALILLPFIPATAEKILVQLGYDVSYASESWEGKTTWGLLPPGQQVTKGEILFPRREDKNSNS